MFKIDHLSDSSGLLAKKITNAVALVILTFFPVVEEAYSDANAIYTSLLDRRTTRNSIFNVESEHISIFLSVSWIRNYMKKRWNVSFQRTRKIKDQCTELDLNPYSMKFEIAACHRTSFPTEEERISAIKSLSDNLLVQNHHLAGTEARYFKITSLRSLFPGRNALFDWIPKFFRGTDNKNWLENVGKITMVGTSANSTRQ
jgi:hypothetical protein